jgi:hypothetical protein
MAWPALAVDQQNVRPAVVVVVDERASRTHGLRKIFLAGSAVIVHKMDAGLRGNIAELDALRLNRRGPQQPRQQ